MITVKRIAHVAVCVPDIEAALRPFADLFGLAAGEREASKELQTEAVLLPLGETSIELIAPHGSGQGTLSRYLERRGPGLHHLALEVEGLDEALAQLKARGVALIDETPHVGARGHRVAFIHPRATGGVLIELVEVT